jgi:hypothetical protein
MQSAAELRRRADQAAAQGRFSEAAELYRKEAAIYRKNGDTNGAKVEEMKADRYSSSVKLFAHLPGARPWIPANLGKWEPPYGCYLGGFIDRDERLGEPFNDENFQTHQNPDAFARLVGKKHASLFCYLAYGKKFPGRWVERMRQQRLAPHIAWEPNEGLGVVQGNTYLRQFALACAEARVPIFLRFASEMNGDWTAYHGDPATYKAKWILVAQTMRQLAPNVAMLWCVNSIPEKNIPDYYPGDEWVDWVGVNFYSVPFYDNERNRPGLADNPADTLKYIYGLYAKKKPIAIGEYGASHLSKVDNKDRSEWAAKKINELYASLPRLYPRVKMVDIFDMDNLKYAEPGRQLNNYSITDSDVVKEGYRRAVAPDYYLSRIGATARPTPIVSLTNGLAVPRGTLRISSWARCYADRFSVQYLLDGKPVGEVIEPGPREMDIEIANPGAHKIAAIVKDDKGKVATKTEVSVAVS